MENKQLLEDILTAQVLLLSRLIEMDKRAGGTTRIGGDYSREAVRLIRSKQPEVLRLLEESR